MYFQVKNIFKKYIKIEAQVLRTHPKTYKKMVWFNDMLVDNNTH
jgi:hypothetical protein